jgi:uncharacterized protein
VIVDVHQHLGWMPLTSAEAPATLDGDRAKRLAFMDRWGIERAVILPSNAVPATAGVDDRRTGNNTIARYVSTQPDRFAAGFGTIHPADGPAGIDEIRRCVLDLGLAGIVWHHHFLGTAIDHPGMHPMLDCLAELRVPAFIHIVAESALEAPWRLEGLAEQHPDVTFVALDGFSSFSQATWITQIARRRPNISFDTGMAASVSHQIVEFVHTIGPERLLLGTDFYTVPALFGLPFPLEEIRSHLGLPTADTERILGGNAVRLLGLGS